MCPSRAAASASNLPALSDDSGLCVRALGNAPGIYSARWAGPDRDFALAMQRLADALLLSGTKDRSAYFVCALSLAWPDGHVESFEGRVEGDILWPPRGDRGFGYDPVFRANGHKISFGLIGREALDPSRASSTARKAAYDVVRYDQQGCYSPHVFFVEKGGAISPETFGTYIAQSLASYEEKFPRRPLSLAEASSLVEWRMAEETRLGGKVVEPCNGNWTVSIQLQDRALRPSGLNRTIRIVAVDDLEETPILSKPYKTLIQTAAISATPERLFSLASMLGEVGVTRVTALGDMTSPEAGWHHDGRFNLLDLVKITEIEARAETAAEDLASYAD